jgi:hypothetical protein
MLSRVKLSKFGTGYMPVPRLAYAPANNNCLHGKLTQNCEKDELWEIFPASNFFIVNFLYFIVAILGIRGC